MAFAACPTHRVSSPKPRQSLTKHRRNGLRALSRGLASLLLGLIIVTTVMIGAGWALAVSFQARSDARSVVAHGIPVDQRAWTGPLNGGTARQWMVLSTWPTPEPQQTATSIVQERFRFAALTVPDSPELSDATSAFADVTGSIGTPPASAVANTFTLASADSTVVPAQLSNVPPPPARLANVPAQLDEPKPALQPRSRPKLASLTVDGIQIKPQEDARPPRTAIYDITARTVYLPNGERLEAHSGLGQFMDDPRSFRMKNRGVTPIGTYDLKLRESLFHGVQAIRLNPVDEKQMNGRDGILAHTYMLGANGQSNGCVSFKDYQRFLRAFMRGEIERIVVVARLDKPPTFASRTDNRSAAN